MMDPEKLFNDLESNNSQEYEETKKKLAEYFNLTKDQWIVQGMMDYFLRTNSVRIVDVLVKVQQPHDKYIFDRLSEWIRGQNKIPALSLFSFIVRKHPTWLYKVEKHALIRDILKLMQTERDIVPLMSALLCIITLLPIIPSLVPNFLQDLFEVFGHLASWNCQNPTTKSLTPKTEHLQIGLYMLFHRLYGMYPCNFMHYLRQEFSIREKGAIFQHTIKPLLQSVRIHPMLITSTRDKEVDHARWKEMEPHDVVVECAKLTLDYYQENSECFANVSAFCTQDSLTLDMPICEQLKSSTSNTTFQITTGVTTSKEKLIDYQKFDNIWSPSIEILATPPPTAGGTVPHTPTPTPSYGVPTVATSSTLDASGASPPEAAVEATPETTPMKDIGPKRVMASNSHAVRSILTSSQPSSPMRKEQTPFHFPDTSSQIYKSVSSDQTNTALQRLIQMVSDRNQSQLHLYGRSGSTEEGSANASTAIASGSGSLSVTLQDLQSGSAANFLKSGPLPSIDSPTNPTEKDEEDQELTELTNQQIGVSRSDTLQDISPESEDCDDNERSPCSTGGLHVPTSRSIRQFARRIKRNRMASYCLNDNSNYLSYGTSPADATNVENFVSIVAKAKVRRTKSWPAIERYQSLDENSVELESISNLRQAIRQQNGELNVHPRAKIIPPATQKKDRIVKNTCGTQTLQQWPQIYEYNLLELFGEENKIRNIPELNRIQPYEILDQYIDRTIKMKQSADARNREELLRDQVQLLQLQLQYERYRREVHAERNRRLLGRSRTNRSLEMDNERLKDQVAKLIDEVRTLTERLRKSGATLNAKEQELIANSNSWKSKYSLELEDNKQLRSKIDNLQRRLNEEIKNRKEVNTEIETLRGELFDMRNDMQQAQFQAELGNHYRQELIKLQSEVLVMGEMQIKCRDKLAELDNLKARDIELEQLQEAYSEEIKELRNALDIKTAQLDTAKARLSELQSQLSSRDAMFTDQKRLLKSAKEEYQEKFNALDKKYEAQKAIIVQMEEYIQALCKNQKAVNLESERTDVASSVDYNSSLSHSLASSEGLSASLRSVTEFRNLQDLVVQPNTASGDTIVAAQITSSVSAQQQTLSVAGRSVVTTTTSSGGRQSATSLDIPVPGPSQQHPHRRHYSHRN